MALFNKTKKQTELTFNRAGGEAYITSPEWQLASLLLNSFVQDQYYRSGDQAQKELIALLPQVSPEFAAKAALYARTVFGMRSISHILAVELAKYAGGKVWAKAFYEKIAYRPDDMMEVIAYYFSKGGKTLPNALKKGFAKAFDRFDAYQLAKYRAEGRDLKLIDVVNLVHPIPTERNADAIKALVEGTLKNSQTWEAKLSMAGQEAVNEEEKEERKAEAWAELLRSKKLGYFALLRNLRNIAEQAPEWIDEAAAQLCQPHSIAKSLVLPFRYLAAFDAIKGLETSAFRRLSEALNRAMELALRNVPRFEGSSLIVLDDSGSMTSGTVKGQNRSPIQIGALFAAALYKSNPQADLMAFSDTARYLRCNAGDTLQSLSNSLMAQARAAGTDFHSIFRTANRAYDRIIILSDMQGWIGNHAPTRVFADYCGRFGANPYIYSFDLQGYGSLQFPQNKVFALAGFSEKVFDLMATLETRPQTLLAAIEAIEL